MTKQPEPDHSIEAPDAPQVEDVGNPTPISPDQDTTPAPKPATKHKH